MVLSAASSLALLLDEGRGDGAGRVASVDTGCGQTNQRVFTCVFLHYSTIDGALVRVSLQTLSSNVSFAVAAEYTSRGRCIIVKSLDGDDGVLLGRGPREEAVLRRLALVGRREGLDKMTFKA